MLLIPQYILLYSEFDNHLFIEIYSDNIVYI